ncbi:MAG: haloalkane dehalogenase [Bacteroidota bacterium]
MKNIIILLAIIMASASSLAAQAISAEFPFESKYLEVYGAKMHYVEEYKDESNPDQLTFLFLHGNPTSNYLWRNIIPYVEGVGSAIAPDLIGMGKSDKPEIDYTFADHAKYLEEFIRLKNLKNVVLVLHDWGSGLGFHYASRHEENIVGIAFMEAVTKPLTWKDAAFTERILFKRLRDEKKGHKMIAENNFFIDKFLFELGTVRELTEEEKEYYSAPYPTVESRKPVETWPKEIPFDGKTATNYAAINAYSQWLEASTLPKLLLYATPGMILKRKSVERIKRDFQNLEAVFVGKGKHYLQEDHPHEIGIALQNWAGSLRAMSSTK